MCGSLLSKFRKANNKVDPGVIIFPEPRQDIMKILHVIKTGDSGKMELR